MASPELEARVLAGLIDGRTREREKASEFALWLPASNFATETPLDIVRGVMATHPWPEEWEPKLREVSPKSDTTSWLFGAWLEKAKRWVLYECVPYALIPETKRCQLGGTPYWEMPKHGRAGRKQAVSAFQWEMYRKLQVWARPAWVIQGDNGGTPAEYTELEQAILQAQGKDLDPPDPGALPYAPFDGRVVRQLVARDRLAKMRLRMERLRASGDSDALKLETAIAEQTFRAEFWRWLEATTEPQADYWAWYSGKEEAERITRADTEAEGRAAMDAKDTYLATGELPVVMPERLRR